MNDAQVSLVGNLTSDPQHFQSEDGVVRATFRIAHNSRRRGADGGWVDGDTTYYTVTCWRALAQNVAQCLHKGDPVLVRGTLRGRDWTTAERSGTSLEVTAESVGHDLARGVSTFRRVSRSKPAEGVLEAAAEIVDGAAEERAESFATNDA